MALKRIGILSIGEMGYHWARILTGHGVEVLTYAEDRSETTRRRAENIGVKCLPSMQQLVTDADLIVSIVIPSAAKRVATKVAQAAAKSRRQDLLYLDANAISPMTADQIGKVLSQRGVNFIDGCIIGSAAKMDRGATVYVSGPGAEQMKDLTSYGIAVEVLGAGSTQASAFKIVYAGLTKGLQGLFVELLMGAQRFGLLDEVRKRYEESFPGLLEKVAPSIVGLRIHAARRAEEMDELKRTFMHHGMKPYIAPAVQKVLSSIAALEPSRASETADRDGDLLNTLELFFNRGLLQETRGSVAPADEPSFSPDYSR